RARSGDGHQAQRTVRGVRLSRLRLSDAAQARALHAAERAALDADPRATDVPRALALAVVRPRAALPRLRRFSSQPLRNLLSVLRYSVLERSQRALARALRDGRDHHAAGYLCARAGGHRALDPDPARAAALHRRTRRRSAKR